MGRGHAYIRNVVPPNRVDVVEIENATGKVGAVIKKKIEVAFVLARAEHRHQMRILRFRGLDLKTKDFAIVGGTD